jgi:hypothetical protein
VSQCGIAAARYATLKHGGDRKSGKIKSPVGDLKASIAEAAERFGR